MAGKIRYLIERNGRFHARIVVPLRLRPIVKKVELSVALGPDRRKALRDLPKAVASLQDTISRATGHLARADKSSHLVPPKSDLSPIAAARDHYYQAIAFDLELRDTTHVYAKHGFFDEQYVSDLRAIAIGRADEAQILHAIPFLLRKYGSTDPTRPEWRQRARLLAQAELAALDVAAHRDEGEVGPPVPAFLMEGRAEASTDTSEKGPSIRHIFRRYAEELHTIGKGRGADSRWAPIVDSLVDFLDHDDAKQIKRQDVIRWKDKLLTTLSPKTVRDAYLASARAAFGWAFDNMHLDHNPFSGVKVRLAKRRSSREKGFNDNEALAILKTSRSYKGSAKEHATMTAAKQWTPLLAAYTGARIGELVQLRSEDVRVEGSIHYIRIAPEAGTVKSGLYRDVPLHRHIIREGFLTFVQESGPGPLFYRSPPRSGKSLPGAVVAGRVGKWIRSLDLADKSVQPNHGWRHRLKTVAREKGLDPRVIDAIQGHAARTAGETYGDVTLKAKDAVIQALPHYDQIIR